MLVGGGDGKGCVTRFKRVGRSGCKVDSHENSSCVLSACCVINSILNAIQALSPSLQDPKTFGATNISETEK